ncbi:MAG TPA: GH116 family glycosyl hydrolase [Hanamia sp.]
MKNYKYLLFIPFLFSFNALFAQQSSNEKQLDKLWLKSLYANTGRTVYKGDQLKTIGMPVGGIAAGTLYIRGDGSLAQWWIANNAYNTGAGGNSPLITPFGIMPMNYNTFTPASFIDQGFKIKVKSGGKTVEKELNRKGFNNISFIGEYPVAEVKYEDSNQTLPLDITMKAFSPFIPLDSKESATPGTYLIFKIKNKAKTAAKVELSGWLQNPVCLALKNLVNGNSRNQTVKSPDMQSLVMNMVPGKEEPLKETMFDDFEEGTYNVWTVTGNAFGSHPAQGALPEQQKVRGFSGNYLINSFAGGDKSTGKMVSKEFTIDSNYINALIGGGSNPKEIAFELIVDGKVAFSATGENSEKLEEMSWNVKDLKGKKAHFEIIDNNTGPWGHILVDRITFSNAPAKRIASIESHPYFGNIALSVLSSNAVVIPDKDLMTTTPAEKKLGDKLVGEITNSFELAPGEEKEVVFMLTWYFPNRPLHYGGGVNWGNPIPTEGPAIGNMYANWYVSALDVAHWLQTNEKRLTELTYRFHKSYYEDANLPYWLRDRIMMPVSTLATETAQWWATDKFWAWEGVGSCPGTCTHVWNYEQALAHLFPDLEKNIRERTDFSASLEKDGGVLTRNGAGGVRIDGHIGTILKSYREYLNSENDFFLTRNWEKIKKIIEYAIAQDAADGNTDGVITNQQPNTYDGDFYGANTYVGGLYLAALKASADMALKMNDKVFADSCEALFKSGSNLSVNELWNDKYFIQKVDLKEHPASQYANGCLSDQLFGQTWAHLLDLGYIYPKDMVKKTLQSIWNFNWKTDVGRYNKAHPPERIFAQDGEPGLINCTWPLGKYQGSDAVPYKSEVWTGVEYQVATNMIYEGMIDEGLSIIKGIDERYSPEKHNPWNEIECGDHYSRALASWGVLLAIEDFYYDGPEGILSFAPKIQKNNFNGFFTTVRSWGNLVQTSSGKKQVNEIQVAYGKLYLNTLCIKTADGQKPKNISLLINGKPHVINWKMKQEKLFISGINEWLKARDDLKVVMSL